MLQEVFERNQIVNDYIEVLKDSVGRDSKYILDTVNEKGASESLVYYAQMKLSYVHEELQTLSDMVYRIGRMHYLCDEEKQKENEELKLHELMKR